MQITAQFIPDVNGASQQLSISIMLLFLNYQSNCREEQSPGCRRLAGLDKKPQKLGVQLFLFWYAHSSGWDQWDLNTQACAFFFFFCSLILCGARVIFPTEVNGSLLTDETDLHNVPALASNDAGGDHLEKEWASYSNQKSLIGTWRCS